MHLHRDQHLSSVERQVIDLSVNSESICQAKCLYTQSISGHSYSLDTAVQVSGISKMSRQSQDISVVEAQLSWYL